MICDFRIKVNCLFVFFPLLDQGFGFIPFRYFFAMIRTFYRPYWIPNGPRAASCSAHLARPRFRLRFGLFSSVNLMEQWYWIRGKIPIWKKSIFIF